MSQTIQKSNSQVESVKSLSKREFDNTVRSKNEFEFNAADMAGSYSGNPELWAIWYSQLLDDIFTGVKNLFLAPLSVEESTVEDSVEHFKGGLQYLTQKAAKRTEDDTTPLVKSRKVIEDFHNENSDQFTLLISHQGGECRVECLDGFIEEQIIKFTVHDSTGNADSIDESTLREHSNEVRDYFNGYSPYRRRPQKKYKRTLCVSVQREENGYSVTVGVDEIRVRGYSVWEKILRKLGQDFTTESYMQYRTS